MEKIIFNNGVKLIYKHIESDLSSFCIGFNAGALVEKEKQRGLAHAVEHMLFKGTKSKNENEINSQCDELFGFNNAMTNYPYAIYYGTTLSADFNEGLGLFADIILNPIFPIKGFKEEMNVIQEELKEWKDSTYQYCEDELFSNAFAKRRIRDLIIGTEENIEKIKLEEIRDFYNLHYSPRNCVISVVSGIELSKIIHTVENQLGDWNNHYFSEDEVIYENNCKGKFVKYSNDMKGAKVMFCFPIHTLNKNEIKALEIFNTKFGVGTSSILYDEIRTKNGLVYDICSYMKNENGIKLFMIKLGTSVDNISKCIDIINKLIKDLKESEGNFNKDEILKLSKRVRLKRELEMEKSIQLSKILTVYEIMYELDRNFLKKMNDYSNITEEEINKVIRKVLVNPTIQILRPK